MKEFYVDEKTAQLILDAIAWCNQDWREILEWNDVDTLEMDRADFVRFCKARGIAGVERKVIR